MSDQWSPFGQEPAGPPAGPNWAPPPAAASEPPANLSRRALREAQAVQAGQVKEQKQANRRRPLAVALIVSLVALVGVVGFVVGKPIVEALTKPKEPPPIVDFEGPGTGQASITIQLGDPGSAIAEKLVEAGVIASTAPFITAFTNAGDKANSIQPGVCAGLRKEMSAAAALEALLQPDACVAISFIVPEGKRAEEVYQIIGEAIAKSELPLDADQALIDQTASERADAVRQAADPAAIGLPPEANGMIEGWLEPKGYQFDVHTAPVEILSQMVAGTVEQLEALEVPRERWLETVIVASIVEMEARRLEDRPKLARVIYNRLDKGSLLQMDSTVAYGVGRFDGKLATTDAERENANPYNTYKNAGLPVGAITNPSPASLEAAVNPAAGAWVFVCVVNPETGELEFNETAEGHAASVEKWKQWEREHGG
ncbi:MAG: endolytic transglycosylase MltG [Bifidobacteriaceae bacterium]|nr:endolytic transglycosylase MltG [Bifidobacteriaceae bacterium]